MKILFDETNLLASMVGEAHGVTPAEYKAQMRRGPEVVKAFRKLVDRGEVGFPSLPFQTDALKQIQAYARKVRGSYDTVCVLGIGGSALGAWALDCALRGPHPVQKPFSRKNPRLVILDNVDPALVGAALEVMDPGKTLVLAVTKQGGTAETGGRFAGRARVAGQTRAEAIGGHYDSGSRRSLRACAAGKVADLRDPGKCRRAVQRALGGGAAAGGADRAGRGKAVARRCRHDRAVLANGSAAQSGATGGAASSFDLDCEEQDHPRGVPVFQPPVGDGLLVPAALGGIARQDQNTRGRKCSHRADARRCSGDD
jgi:hypothetical protein